jgi:hypothetical protein
VYEEKIDTSIERIIEEEKTRETGFDDVERKRRARKGPTVILYPSKMPMRETSPPPSP